MGQQQLLLIILVAIVVGIATFVAIQVFGEAADASVIDAAMRDLVEIGVEAQGFFMRPTQMGGGGRSFENIDFRELAVPIVADEDSPLIGTNLNAIYTISGRSANEFLVTAELNDNNNRFIAIRICQRESILGTVGNGEAPQPESCSY